MYSRREVMQTAIGAAAVAGLPSGAAFAARQESTVRGVKLGLITGTLNPLPADAGKDQIDVIIQECLQVGATNIELVDVGGATPPEVINGGKYGQAPDQVTPEYTASREVLRQWRIARPLDRFRQVRQKFSAAGLNLFSYVWTVADDYTDAEMDATFRQLKALGVRIFCTNQTRVGMGAKIAPHAERHGISPAWHPHSNVRNPNEVATPESMEKLLAISRSFRINLDIGHFTAGNNDAVAFLTRHHDRITHLHIKDRQRNDGPNVQLGTGDTPIVECLRQIRDHRWPIYAILEREYRGPGTPVEEARWQMDYMKKALNA